MLEPMEHNRDERVVSGPIPSPSTNAACNQAKIVLIEIAGAKGVETTMILPQLLTPECQEETYAV